MLDEPAAPTVLDDGTPPPPDPGALPATGDGHGGSAPAAPPPMVVSGRQPRHRRPQPAVRRRASFALQAAVLWVLSWPTASLAVYPGLDPSYRFSLQQAYIEGRRFGSEIIFTYGPLGFLSFPDLYYTRPTFMSIALRSAVMLVACAFVLGVARRVVGHPALAFVAAYALVTLTFASMLAGNYLAEAIWALFVAACLAALLAGRDLDRRERLTFVVALGAVAALLGLMKLNTGLTAGAIGALAAASLAPARGWRSRDRLVDLGAYLASGALCFLAGWVAAGQHLADLVPYVRTTRDLTGGYSSAMSIEEADNRWEYAAAAVVVAFAVVAVLQVATAATRRQGRRPLWAVVPVAVFGLATLALFKHGFVRHDAHSFGFFVGVPVLVLGFLQRQVLAVAAGAIGLSVALSWSPVNADVASALDVRQRLDGLSTQVRVLLSPAERTAVRGESRARLAQGYGLDATTVDLLAGRRVHVDPWESSVLFAHPQSTWVPPPVFQSYVAYTAALDHENATALAEPDGPEVLLRENVAVDGRHPAFQSPEYLLAMVCNFTEAHATARWTVLVRTPDRCGEPEPVAAADATTGEVVALPRPQDCAGVLTMRVDGLMATQLEKLLDLVYKGPRYALAVAGGEYRFIPLTASQPHVLWAPGDPAWMQGPLSFRGADGVSIQAVPSLDLFDHVGADDRLRYTFECVPLATPA